MLDAVSSTGCMGEIYHMQYVFEELPDCFVEMPKHVSWVRKYARGRGIIFKPNFACLFKSHAFSVLTAIISRPNRYVMLSFRDIPEDYVGVIDCATSPVIS